MSLTLQISYRPYSDNIDITITSFTYLAINNRGAGTIDLRRGDPAEPATAVYFLDTGEAFSWPVQGSEYDQVILTSNGNDYSLITDGVIS